MPTRRQLLQMLSASALVPAVAVPASGQWLRTAGAQERRSAGVPAGSGAVAPGASSNGVLRIGIGGPALLHYLPLVVAQQLRFFADEGLPQVQLHSYHCANAAMAALRVGELDVCSAAYEHCLTEQLQGRYYRAFMLQGRAPQLALGVAARSAHVGYSLAELAKLPIGVNALHSSAMHAMQMAFLHHGVSLELVQFVELGTDTASALESGRVQVVVQHDPQISELEERGDVQIVCDLRNPLECEKIFGGSLPSAALYAPEVVLQRRPMQIQALTNASLRALMWLQTASMLDLVKLMPAHYMQGSRRAYLSAFEKMRLSISADGLMPADGPAIMLRNLQRVDPAVARARPTALEPARSFSNQFALRAKQKMRS